MVIMSRDDVMRNPIVFLLALGFGDKGLKGITCVKQFIDVKPRSQSEAFTFE